MKDFRVIYKILNVYKNALWEDGVTSDALMPDKLGTSETHIRNIQLILRNAGLLIGTNGHTVITLAGLEYLDSNEQMKKIAGEHNQYGY